MAIMLTRRRLLSGGVAGLACSSLAGRARAQAVLGDDGLYHQPWFLESFLDLADDLRAAGAHGRRLAILWELRGCPFCKRLHQVNFADAAVSRYIRKNFDILQLNIIGAREVTDFDGERLPEKRFAAKYGVYSTPMVQFFGETAETLAGKPPAQREVLRMKGYVPPEEFRRTFAFVAERAYGSTDLETYLARPAPGGGE
ncbi:Thioredoxin-like domain-containing protein [Methylobacterium gossipiicola]|uniref:Thioredoxin-like domain-containing protein n=2 Tax=Methylobacterium gossipiicola TaxID=582675 RepID=A0A1I2UV28_9HYPH|nr:Thioredoxin-like domain-containing protein [Methylobacterium gossipiicola]